MFLVCNSSSSNISSSTPCVPIITNHECNANSAGAHANCSTQDSPATTPPSMQQQQHTDSHRADTTTLVLLLHVSPPRPNTTTTTTRAHPCRRPTRMCGIIGIFKQDGDVNVELYEGLLMLQHRWVTVWVWV